VALALTLLALFTVVGLGLSFVAGWTLAHTAGAMAARHVAIAIPSVLFSLFTQSMVLFFFIGTGKLLKEAAAKRPDEAGRNYILARVRDFKVRTSGLATLAPITALVAGLTARAPAWVHLTAAAVTLLVHVRAFFVEVVAMSETNQLMEEAETLVPPPAP